MSYTVYHSNNDYLTDASGYLYVGLEREQVPQHLLKEYDRVDVNKDRKLSFEEVAEEVKSDVKGLKRNARNDLLLSTIPLLLGGLGRKIPGAVLVCSLMSLAGLVSAGFQLDDAKSLEKDVEKFNNKKLDTMT